MYCTKCSRQAAEGTNNTRGIISVLSIDTELQRNSVSLSKPENALSDAHIMPPPEYEPQPARHNLASPQIRMPQQRAACNAVAVWGRPRKITESPSSHSGSACVNHGNSFRTKLIEGGNRLRLRAGGSPRVKCGRSAVIPSSRPAVSEERSAMLILILLAPGLPVFRRCTTVERSSRLPFHYESSIFTRYGRDEVNAVSLGQPSCAAADATTDQQVPPVLSHTRARWR